MKKWWILNPEIAYPYLKYEGAQQVYVVGVSPGETILRAYLENGHVLSSEIQVISSATDTAEIINPEDVPAELKAYAEAVEKKAVFLRLGVNQIRALRCTNGAYVDKWTIANREIAEIVAYSRNRQFIRVKGLHIGETMIYAELKNNKVIAGRIIVQ